jgi:hypothetical protein
VERGDTTGVGVRTEADDVKERSRHALEKASRSTWLERTARWGLVVRGVLYVVVAVIVVQVARGHREQRADRNGALYAVLHQPFGRLLLLALAVGMAGYAIWRFVEAIVGPAGDHEDGTKALGKRGLYAARGLIYTAFFLSAIKLLVWSNAPEGSDRAESDWTARVLGWPGGRWIVVLVGVAIIIGGLCLGGQGLLGGFRDRLKSGEMSTVQRRSIVVAGAVGMTARSVVAVLIGAFLIGAANHHDPNRAVGIDGAIKRLAARPWGPTVLVLVAAGLAAYGLYSFAEARFRRVGSS